MAPEPFVSFFLAAAGAGAAFIGLLFVAISIHPELTFGRPSANGVPRQLLTEATLVTLGNGFLLSGVALLPTINVGWVALGMGFWGVLWAGRIAILLDRAHRQHAGSWRHRVRVVSVSTFATVWNAGEFGVGLALLRTNGTAGAVTGLAIIILGLYTLGMARAWILLGDPRQGWSGWLNPLEDGQEDRLTHGEQDGRTVVAASSTSRAHRGRRRTLSKRRARSADPRR
jgi:hypothetical protein